MEKKEKAALLKKERKRSLLDPVADVVAKTDTEPIEGVHADALDAAQTAERAYLLKKALDAKKAAEAAETIPSKIPTSSKAGLLKKFTKGAPPAAAAIMAYETAALINSEEQREKAYQQYKEMGERDYSADDLPQTYANFAKNGLQGLLDPVGTIYGAGRGLKELMFGR
jgi:Tfp pilus assembly protein PilE